jgi:hypothetical protein
MDAFGAACQGNASRESMKKTSFQLIGIGEAPDC